MKPDTLSYYQQTVQRAIELTRRLRLDRAAWQLTQTDAKPHELRTDLYIPLE